MGIIRLIDVTVKTYKDLVESNSDPKNPSVPKLRLVGGVLMRVPHESISRKLLIISFNTAKKLGYRGDYQKWEEIIINPSEL